MGRRGAGAIVEPVDFGVAELRPDPDWSSGWTLLVDGTPQSYVDIEDPTRLEFEYMRRLASVADTAAPPGAPLRVLHLGGGALTLPRYLAATRPGSVQRVVERDAALIALVRRVLPVPRGADLRVRPADGRDVVEASGPARYDLVVTDVYGGARMPGRFGTVEFARAVARVLVPGGRYAVNLADGAPLAFARAQVATLATVFGELCLIAEPGVLRGRRYGNLVLVGAGSAGELPVAELARDAAGDVFPARLVAGEELSRFAAGARPVTDATATDSPPPPRDLFS
jgi:spermidine synthase